ncbi:MAG TPA: hypothetical protein VKT75_10750 [Acidobacteriaceae bacterium]|nr:hypothetical protein [Acidobacteriaceae bacterium]
MKTKNIAFLLALTGSLILAVPTHAQNCATGAQLFNTGGVCVTPDGSQNCNINVPMGPGYTTFVQGQVYCCGTPQISFFYGPPYLCQQYGRILREPGLVNAAVQAQLETGEEFLVADCQGNVVPFKTLLQPSFAKAAPIVFN